MSAWTTLVQAEDLAARLGAPELVVVDCRHSLTDPAAGVAAWSAGHVHGAAHADMDRDLSAPPAPGSGAGRHPWPAAAALRQRLGAWGVGPGSQVVAYDAGDGAFAARLWFLLRALGHGPVAVLDGGWARWSALGLPCEAAVPASPAPAEYPAAEFDRARLLDAAQVQAHLRQGGLLLDARAGERFRGRIEPVDRVAGHVPGARNRPYSDNLSGGRFKAPARLREEFEALLSGRAPERAVAMCGSGVTACHHLLAMEHAGLEGARLYTGSWSGWIDDPARPVATGTE
ncbi:sulfurtransferase [Luteimonas sp. RD2P54]|uniref:Sulfurtransferase n=1 Tax=Luteimonas endophytica TaxID=3042023 RepID=A0ABT6JBF5_9GAMM|nr:sulfurtransferase [Luteimonas endophytica]MDH5824157.1 sulfurtransferase [Luteimonas endophytica]